MRRSRKGCRCTNMKHTLTQHGNTKLRGCSAHNAPFTWHARKCRKGCSAHNAPFTWHAQMRRSRKGCRPNSTHWGSTRSVNETCSRHVCCRLFHKLNTTCEQNALCRGWYEKTYVKHPLKARFEGETPLQSWCVNVCETTSQSAFRW